MFICQIHSTFLQVRQKCKVQIEIHVPEKDEVDCPLLYFEP